MKSWKRSSRTFQRGTVAGRSGWRQPVEREGAVRLHPDEQEAEQRDQVVVVHVHRLLEQEDVGVREEQQDDGGAVVEPDRDQHARATPRTREVDVHPVARPRPHPVEVEVGEVPLRAGCSTRRSSRTASSAPTSHAIMAPRTMRTTPSDAASTGAQRQSAHRRTRAPMPGRVAFRRRGCPVRSRTAASDRAARGLQVMRSSRIVRRNRVPLAGFASARRRPGDPVLVVRLRCAAVAARRRLRPARATATATASVAHQRGRARRRHRARPVGARDLPALRPQRRRHGHRRRAASRPSTPCSTAARAALDGLAHGATPTPRDAVGDHADRRPPTATATPTPTATVNQPPRPADGVDLSHLSRLRRRAADRRHRSRRRRGALRGRRRCPPARRSTGRAAC